MKEEIIKLSKNIGIDEIGFCNKNNLKVNYNKYKLQDELNYKCSFQIGDISDKDLTNAKYSKYNTVIACLQGYKKVVIKDKNKVYVSGFAVNKDYHKVLKDKLNIICEYLKDNGCISESFVDNNPLDEKLLAYNCGLGFFGKNNLLINKKLGSYFNIGIILTDLKIDSDEIGNYNCSKCNLCINACPNKALNEGILNQKKCLSYLTQKKNLENDEGNNFNNCIYGCDICSLVCPYNKNIEYSKYDGIDMNKFLNMSEEEFKENYKESAFYWRGKKVLDRNINIYKKVDK